MMYFKLKNQAITDPQSFQFFMNLILLKSIIDQLCGFMYPNTCQWSMSHYLSVFSVPFLAFLGLFKPTIKGFSDAKKGKRKKSE